MADNILSVKRSVYYFIGIISIAIISAMGYAFYSSHLMINKYSPLVDATMEIKLELTTAHLWFEEIISGDPYERFESITDHIDTAQWYANAMISGGENQEGRFLPFKDPAIRKEIMDCIDRLSKFKEITNKRYSAVSTSGIGSGIDQEYDKLFRQLIKQIDTVETLLQKQIRHDYATYETVQILLILIIACLTVLIFFIQFRHDQDIHRNIVQMKKAKDMAEESENWLKSAREQGWDCCLLSMELLKDTAAKYPFKVRKEKAPPLTSIFRQPKKEKKSNPNALKSIQKARKVSFWLMMRKCLPKWDRNYWRETAIKSQ